MSAHLAVCGVGAGLAMAGHFPGRPHLWVPHALGVAAMLLAWLPAAQPVGTPVALLGLGTVLGWQLSSRRADGARWSGVADTVAMAALIALTIPGPAHHGAGHTATDGTLPYAVAVVVVWLAVRHRTRPGTRPAGSGRVLGRLRFCGGLVMMTAMTAMLA